MISFYQSTYNPTDEGRRWVQGACLSTDDKPTQGILNGSCLIEMDSGKVYFYDEAGAIWREFGGEA